MRLFECYHKAFVSIRIITTIIIIFMIDCNCVYCVTILFPRDFETFCSSEHTCMACSSLGCSLQISVSKTMYTHAPPHARIFVDYPTNLFIAGQRLHAFAYINTRSVCRRPFAARPQVCGRPFTRAFCTIFIAPPSPLHRFVEAAAPSVREYADAIAATAAAAHVSGVLLKSMLAMLHIRITLAAVALVITEDASGAADLPPLLKQMGIRAELLSCKRHALRISIPLAIQLRLLDADTENSQSLINLLAAVQAAAVVGTFSSGYSRLIFEMACARAGRILPHHSLDLKYFV